jgi:hypothetical protein
MQSLIEPTFSHGLQMRNRGGTRKTGPDRPAEQGGLAGPVRPAQGVPVAVRPVFPWNVPFRLSSLVRKF